MYRKPCDEFDCRDPAAGFQIACPLMEAREWPNPSPDWPPGQSFSMDATTRQRIAATRDQFLHYLEHPRKFAEYLGIKETLERADDDISVYTGIVMNNDEDCSSVLRSLSVLYGSG